MNSLFIDSFGNSSEFLHSYIHLGNIEEVKQFLQRNPGRNNFFNDNKESAASVALKQEKLEIYELLIANGNSLGLDENVEAIVANSSLEFRRKVCDINRKYSKDSKPKHLMSLYYKSKFSYNTDKQHEDKYYKVIVSAFDFLNKFSFIEPILKVCSFYSDLNIFFDFNNESVEFMDPTKTKCVLGTTYIHSGFIYIGAKGLLIKEKRNGVLGTLIHELSHFALNMIYSNNCCPYFTNDSEKKSKFQEIVALSEQKAQYEAIINRVYNAHYHSDTQAAELIVRVPHLTAFYSENPDRYFEVTEQFSELFEFFEQHTLVDLESEYQKLQEMQKVKDLNKDFVILTLIEKTQIFFKEDFVSSLNMECNATENIVQISSNCPRLTMIYFYQLLRTHNNFDGYNIFTSIELLKKAEVVEKLMKSCNLCVKPTIYIECEGSDIDVEPLEKLFSQVGKQRIVVIAKPDLDLSTKASKYEVKHTWNQLDVVVQHGLISQSIKFQGIKVLLKDLIIDELYDSIPLENLFSENGIIAGKQVEALQDQIYVERKYSIPNNDKLDNSESRTLNETLELLKDNKCILLSNEPGMGKTTELKTMAIKLKEKLPLNWVVLIDLKKFANSYHKTGNIRDFDNAEMIVNFLCKKILYLEGFESKLFADLFDSGKIVFLTDGFDEISPSFKDFVMNLSKAIVNKSENQIWISTRPHLEGELVDTLKPLLLKIESFTAQNQQEYIEKFCSLKGLDKERVKSYLDVVIHVVSNMSSPLITRMIAETFEEGFTQEINNFNLFSLYKRFVEKMISRTFEKGSEYQNDLTKYLDSSQSINDVHCKFALKTILGENKIVKEAVGRMIQDCSNFSIEEIARFGILYFDDSSHQFIHKSFAEYFVASLFIRHIFLENNNCSDSSFEQILLCYACTIQEGYDNQMILYLMENGLKFYKVNNVTVNKFEISKVLNFLLEPENQSFLHQLVKCGCENLIGLTSSFLNVECCMKNFLLAKDNGENILMTLAKESSFEMLQKFWQFLKSNLDHDEFDNLFLEKNKNGQNVYQLCLENKNKAVQDLLVSSSVPIFKNNEANILNQLGLLLSSINDYKGAKLYFDKACRACVNGYREEETFKENRDYAKAEVLNQTGEKLFDDKKFSKANKKFDAAINHCPPDRNVSKYKNKRADILNIWGLELCDKLNFEGAAALFNDAYQTSDENYESKETFQENRDHAKAEVLNQAGEKLFLDKKFSEAKEKFDAAISQCPSNRTASLAKYKNKKPDTLNYLGLDLFKKLNFEGAAAMFNDAYLACDENYQNKKTYRKNRDHARAEVLYQTGEELFLENKYSEAIHKFDAAISQCPSKRTASITKYRKKRADTLNTFGLKLQNESNFAGAAAMFNDACLACYDNYENKKTYRKNRDHARAEVLYQTGEELFLDKKYSKAIEKFDAAIIQCPLIITASIAKYKNKKADALNYLGLKLRKKSKFEGAAAMFDDAYQTCDENYESKETFQENRDHARAEFFYQAGVLEHQLMSLK